MIEYLKFEDGVVVEVDVQENKSAISSEQNAGGAISAPPPIKEIEKTFSDACGGLEPIINSLHTKINELGVQPDEIELSLGIKLSTEAGVILAKAAAEGSIQVKLTWKKA